MQQLLVPEQDALQFECVLSHHVGVCDFFSGQKGWMCGWVLQYVLKDETKPWLTTEICSISSWAVIWAKMMTERYQRSRKPSTALHPCYPLDSAGGFFSLDNREPLRYAVIALDLHWGKPCVFALCALGATWQDQCLCGCIQKPHGSLCPWAEIIWALHWITNPNPQHTVLCATHSCRHASHGIVNGHLLRWAEMRTSWMNTEEALFDLSAEGLAVLHLGDS